jgi:hypothetical protein
MYVYAVRSPEEWLYRHDALMVYLSRGTAQEDAHEPDAEVVRLDPEEITRKLESGELEYVRLALGGDEEDPEEHYGLELKAWLRLIEHMEAEQRAALERYAAEMVKSGKATYDLKTGRYKLVTHAEEE